jgi:yeast amino acid transporter
MSDWREGPMKPYLLQGNAGQLLGFWSACCQAFLSYSGVELIGIAAGETERPRENLPKIVRHVSVRIVVYYVGAVLALGLTVSSNDPILRLIVTNGDYSYYSPFTLMAQRAGVPVMSHLFNGVAVIACLSVVNASLYVTVRH